MRQSSSPNWSAVAVFLVTGFGCASAIPIPAVEEAETRAVEREIAAGSRAELELAMNLRYWEIFLTDPENMASFSDEHLSLLNNYPLLTIAGALQLSFVQKNGLQPVELSRVSPASFRSLGVQAPGASVVEVYKTADALERFQAPVHNRIRDVGERIGLAAGRPDVEVIPEPDAGLNAFVPIEFNGNRVFVGTELALTAASDDELACAIGHEFAHLTEGHSSAGAWARLGKQVLAGTAAVAVAAAAAYANEGQPLTQQQIQGAVVLGQLTSFALAEVPLRLSGWERGHEREADAVGLFYAWEAGYDPSACATNMMRMAQAAAAYQGEERHSWWQVHPVTSERVVYLRKLAVEAKAGRLGKR